MSRRRFLSSSTTTATAAGSLFARGPAALAGVSAIARPPLTRVALNPPASIATTTPARSAAFVEPFLPLLTIYGASSTRAGGISWRCRPSVKAIIRRSVMEVTTWVPLLQLDETEGRGGVNR